MLIQLPSGSPDQPGSRASEEATTFEAGLRRDLASAPVVSYDAMLGGWGKRAADFAIAVLTAPVWLPVMLVAAGVAKARHRDPVFQSEDRIGYGGQAFRCLSLRMSAPSAPVTQRHAAEGEALTPANDLSSIAGRANARRAKWGRAIERLPQMINVLRGDMAIVGPKPLTRAQLEPLRTARRYYLSARPGVVGIAAMARGEDEANLYKPYAMNWAVTTDALILWDSLRALLNRGELWRPPAKREPQAAPVVDRRRNAS